MQTLQDLIDPSELDYIIISHTEPNHSGLVNCILQLAPRANVVGSRVALQFLEDMVNQPFQKKIVKNGVRVDLGNGHELEC